MTTIALPSLAGQQHIVLHDVTWGTYQSLLRELEQRHLRLTFDNGSLEITSPLPIHELWKKRLARMIETMALERGVPIDTLGSTTFGREDLAKGLEPDECYYVAHAADIRGKTTFDFSVDPPPDLAIEVDITSRSVRRQPIYAALGVPELWRFNGTTLHVLRLGKSRKYRLVQASGVFQFLPMRLFEAFLLRMGSENQLPVLQDFRKWLHSL